MGAQKHSLEIPIQEENNDSWKDEIEDEETLSLCDFVISSDSNEHWNNNSSSSDHHHHHHHQDFFEFFSQDFPAATSTFSENENNIIFCGKIIPYKEEKQQQIQQPNVEHRGSHSLESKIMNKKEANDDQAVKNPTTTTSCLFPWKNLTPHSFTKSRTYPPSSTSRKASSKAKSLRKSLSLPAAGANHGGYRSGDYEKVDFSVKKVSNFATPVKSRWYLFAFGVGRFPMEIELKDMKMRQSRVSKAMKKIQPDRGCNDKSENVAKGKSSGKGLWRLIKVLGWKSKDAKQV